MSAKKTIQVNPDFLSISGLKKKNLQEKKLLRLNHHLNQIISKINF